MPHKRPDKIYFFGTGLIDLMYPQAGMAGIQILQRAGIKVLFPQDQNCCGQPAFNSSYCEEAKAVVEQQMALFTHCRLFGFLCRYDETSLPHCAEPVSKSVRCVFPYQGSFTV